MTTARRVRASEAGYTLTEVLAAVIVLGIAITAVIGAMGSSILASRLHQDVVTADSVVRSYAEAVTAPQHFQTCAGANYSPGGVGYTVPAGFQASAVSVERWNGANPPGFGGCNPPCPPPADCQGLLRVTLETHAVTGSAKQQLQVLVRRP